MILSVQEMRGKDGRVYKIVIEDIKGYTNFKVIDSETDAETDDGWLAISKNGVLRLERLK